MLACVHNKVDRTGYIQDRGCGSREDSPVVSTWCMYLATEQGF